MQKGHPWKKKRLKAMLETRKGTIAFIRWKSNKEVLFKG